MAAQGAGRRRPGGRLPQAAWLLAALLGCHPALALDLDDVLISKVGHGYRVQTRFCVAGSVDQVTDILTDYTHPGRLTPAVKKREVVGRWAAITRVRTEMHGCAMFYCKDLILTQDVSVDSGTIRADIVADESDFRAGYMLWRVTGNDSGGADVYYESLVDPDFFVPPLIGRYFMRKWLRRQVVTIAERLAAETAPRTQDPATAAVEEGPTTPAKATSQR